MLKRCLVRVMSVYYSQTFDREAAVFSSKCFPEWTDLRFPGCVSALSRVQPSSGSLCSGAAAALSLSPVSSGNPRRCASRSSKQTVRSRRQCSYEPRESGIPQYAAGIPHSADTSCSLKSKRHDARLVPHDNRSEVTSIKTYESLHFPKNIH